VVGEVCARLALLYGPFAREGEENVVKLGLVLECDTGGADELVLTCLARRLKPGTSIQAVALGSKAAVFTKGVEAAVKLVETDKCDLGLIVWDLKPLWSQVAAKDCEDEVAEMRKQLEAVSPATRKKIRLLCLTYELETWLIAEDRAVSTYLSTPQHKVRFKAPGDPSSKTDAKAFLNTEITKVRGKRNRYVDYKEAIRLVKLWPDTSRVGAIDSFQRFSKLVTGQDKAAFQQTGDACADLVHQAAQMGRA